MKASANNQYLTTISQELGLHPKTLHELRRQREARGEHFPAPSVVLPDGKQLYHAERFKKWYMREVAPHWSARGTA